VIIHDLGILNNSQGSTPGQSWLFIISAGCGDRQAVYQMDWIGLLKVYDVRLEIIPSSIDKPPTISVAFQAR
jgi:hypothetical protein